MQCCVVIVPGMSTWTAKEAYRLRKHLVEPVFGIIKEQQGARKFLLRGLTNVAAEWTVLATAFNLRTLWRVWRSRPFVKLLHGPKPQSRVLNAGDDIGQPPLHRLASDLCV